MSSIEQTEQRDQNQEQSSQKLPSSKHQDQDADVVVGQEETEESPL